MGATAGWERKQARSFNGAGDTWTPAIINCSSSGSREIPLASSGWPAPEHQWLPVRVGLEPRGVFIALTVSYSTPAFVSAVLFRRGRCEEKKLWRDGDDTCRTWTRRST